MYVLFTKQTDEEKNNTNFQYVSSFQESKQTQKHNTKWWSFEYLCLSHKAKRTCEKTLNKFPFCVFFRAQEYVFFVQINVFLVFQHPKKLLSSAKVAREQLKKAVEGLGLPMVRQIPKQLVYLLAANAYLHIQIIIHIYIYIYTRASAFVNTYVISLYLHTNPSVRKKHAWGNHKRGYWQCAWEWQPYHLITVAQLIGYMRNLQNLDTELIGQWATAIKMSDTPDRWHCHSLSCPCVWCDVWFVFCVWVSKEEVFR